MSSKISVIPTDTLYGIVASALDVSAVQRLYAVRGRNPEKPCIILMAGADELSRFGITPNRRIKRFLDSVWPGPVSVILPVSGDEFAYLHRGTHSLAFRVPKNDYLQKLLRETGPLLAPSANPEGKPPAETITEARAYFGDAVDQYVDGGRLTGEPSTVIDLQTETPVILRQGRANIKLDDF